MLTVNGDEGTDDQPLDFSQKSHSVSDEDLKKSHPFAWKKEVEKHIFTTPSPSPPESQSQVLCQILSGSIFGNGNKVSPQGVGHVDHNLPGSGGNNDCNSNGSMTNDSVNDHIGHGHSGGGGHKNNHHHSSDAIGSKKCKSTNGSNPITDSPMSPLASLLDTTSPLIASQALASALVSSANSANFMATTNNLLTTAPAFFDPKKKYTRPFKAYPTTRDMGLSSLSSIYNMPLQMSLDASLTGHNLLASTSDTDYLQYRAQVMSQKRAASDGRRNTKSSPGSNSNSGAALSPTTCHVVQVDGSGSKRKSSTCSNSNRSTSANLSDDSNQHSSCGEGESGSTNSTSSSLGVGGSATQAKLNGTQGQSGSEETNGSNAQAAQATTTTPASGRKRGRPLPDDQKDDAYWERRRKNNEAAKRSRDARRAKEDEIAIRAAFLEQENIKLRLRIATVENENLTLQKELTKLRRVMSLNN